MGQLALISGATGGIGSVITSRLWLEGYSLIILGKTQHKMDTLLKTLNDTKQRGQIASGICMDISKACDWWRVRTLIETYESQGTPLALLVCAHGAAPVVKPTTHLTTADMRHVWEVDVLGSFLVCRVAIQSMLAHQQGGSIVLVSSLHATMTYPQRLPYATNKAALGGMVRALAVEFGAQGIRTNCILPWQVEGARSQAFIDAAVLEGDDLAEAYKQRSPMRRLIQPEEVADAVLFLARNETMNGCELVMDGGVSSSMWYKPYLEPSHAQPPALSQP